MVQPGCANAGSGFALYNKAIDVPEMDRRTVKAEKVCMPHPASVPKYGMYSGTIRRDYLRRWRRLISTATKPNSAVSVHSGQLPVRAYGVSPVVGVTLVVNTSRVNCGIIA